MKSSGLLRAVTVEGTHPADQAASSGAWHTLSALQPGGSRGSHAATGIGQQCLQHVILRRLFSNLLAYTTTRSCKNREGKFYRTIRVDRNSDCQFLEAVILSPAAVETRGSDKFGYGVQYVRRRPRASDYCTGYAVVAVRFHFVRDDPSEDTGGDTRMDGDVLTDERVR